MTPTGDARAAAATTGWPRRWWLLAIVVAMGSAGAWYSTHRRSAATSTAVTVGQGRAQLLDFGMGICEQCKRLKPVMERASRELGGMVEVRLLDIRQDDNERLAERFNMTTMPLVVLVDGAGQERWRHEGYVEFDELSAAVRERLSAQAAASSSGGGGP